jgi:hypothetical protein
MSANRPQPHVPVLPEDDANTQLANGFHLDLDQLSARQSYATDPDYRRLAAVIAGQADVKQSISQARQVGTPGEGAVTVDRCDQSRFG